MSKSKPNKVFVIRTLENREICYVIARHRKGALTIAHNERDDIPKSAYALSAPTSDMMRAINYKAPKEAK